MIVNQYGGITHAANPHDGVQKVSKNAHATQVCALLRYQEEKQNTKSQKEKNKEITSIKIMYQGGTETVKKLDLMKSVGKLTQKYYEICIEHNGQIQIPTVFEGVTVEYNRKGSPGKLQCKVYKFANDNMTQSIDSNLNFQEGDAIRFYVNNVPYFYGYIFKKSRSSDGIINITAYDQLRYFKNKNTMIFGGKTSELLYELANDYNLQIGEIQDSQFCLQPQIFDNKSLFDIVQEFIDKTLIATGKLFVLYDDFGFLCLKDMDNMVLEDFLVNENNASDFDYSTSIDEQSYNKIIFAVDNKQTGVREIYQTQNGESMAKWGTLQYYQHVDSKEIAMTRLQRYLKVYNRKTRNLQIKNILGDLRVRGGSGIYVNLNLGDIIVNHRMWVEKVKHSFKENEHFMDVMLRGWEFTE